MTAKNQKAVEATEAAVATTATTPVQGEFVKETEEFAGVSAEPGFGTDIESNFDTEDEYKQAPLIPNGKYKGAIVEVKFNKEEQTIEWVVSLSENGGLMNDGESPIDGNQLSFKNWLPKDGDENKPTKKGNQSTRQAKINMLHKFAEKMKVNMKNPAVIMNSIYNSEWVGRPVRVDVEIREWEGNYFNNIKDMQAM